MAEYIKRVPFEALIEHLNKKEPCKNCYHRAACDAWVRNATTLYDDYSYSVKNCPYYKPAADVVEVVRCKDCLYFEYKIGSYGTCEHWHTNSQDIFDLHFCGYAETRTPKERGEDK